VLKFCRAFSKARGVWGDAPCISVFFLIAFSFAHLSSKEKAGKKLALAKRLSPRGFSTSIATFSLQEGAAKKKLAKRNGVFVGAAHTRDLLKKVDQNLHTEFVRTHL
jgi:hypothetical protein